ncbi:MAG: T9SS type A sorting domain-containing protein [Bacteroidia bacterium]
MKRILLYLTLAMIFPSWLIGQKLDTSDYRFVSDADCFEAGAGEDLKLWFKTSTSISNGVPSTITTSGAVNVIGWDDEAGDGTSAEAQNLENNGANNILPSFLTDQINGYGAVRFANNDRLVSDAAFSESFMRKQLNSSDETLIIMVLKRNGGSTILQHGSGTGRTQVDHEEFWWGQDPSGSPTTSRYLDFSSNSVGSDFEIRTIRVSEDYTNTPATAEINTYKNGVIVQTNTTGAVVNLASSITEFLTIGDDANTTSYDISIAEIMIFNYDYGIVPQDLEQIHTHLALKYGISLEGTSPEYLSWDGATDLFESSVQCNSEGANSLYSNRITGIFKNGRCFSVSHLKSTNVESTEAILTGALTHNGGSFDSPADFERNRTYFLWGDNGLTASFSALEQETVDVPTELGTLVAPDLPVRIKRKWKVNETYRSLTPTGNIGEITYEFDLSNASVPGEVDDKSKLWILIDTDLDGSFQDETVSGGGIINPFEWDETTKVGKFKHDFATCETFSFAIQTPPVPVTWFEFEANKLNDKVLVDWATATEVNNSHFEVQRSLDGTNWEVLGVQSGMGTYHDISRYNFTDANPVYGVNFYRIKQIDYDGKFSFTDVRRVDFTANLRLDSRLYPNPANESLSIELYDQDIETINYTIVDLSGAVVLQGEVNSGFESIGTSELKEGVYMLNLQKGDVIKTNRFIIAR